MSTDNNEKISPIDGALSQSLKSEDGGLHQADQDDLKADPDRAEKDEKLIQIRQYCSKKDRSGIASLAETRFGLVDDSVRRLSWPILLNVDLNEDELKLYDESHWGKLPEHPDEHQVRLDVDRSFIYYPYTSSPAELNKHKEDLFELIVAVLRVHPRISYFQGFHDICQVVLLVLGKQIATPVIAHIALTRIRDFMLPSLAPALQHLRLLPSLLSKIDPKLCQHLSQTQPFFALAATLTLYAHDIQEYGDIARLFDVFLAREAVLPVYLFTVIILARKTELLEIPADEPEMLHSILSKLPKPLDLDHLISESLVLASNYPPETLAPWRKVSSNSALKTCRYPWQFNVQSIPSGERYFQKQMRELRRFEMAQAIHQSLLKYRAPLGAVGVAVIVSVLAWWLRKPGSSGIWQGIGIIRDYLRKWSMNGLLGKSL